MLGHIKRLDCSYVRTVCQYESVDSSNNYQYIAVFTVGAQGIVRDIVIADPGQDKELTCDVNGTEESTYWQINGSSTLISLSDLLNGAVAGHNRSGKSIVVEDIVMNDARNGSLYHCVIVATPTMGGILITLYVAGGCNE